MYIARGNPDQAEALIEPLDTFQSPTTSSQRNYWFVTVELELAKGNVSEALSLLDQLEASLPHHSEQPAPRLQLLRGVALMAGGRGAEAETVLLAARQSADRFGYRSTAWQVLVSLRKLYLQQGSLEKAETVQQAALAIIDELAAGLEDDDLRERFQAGARSRLPVSLPFRAERSDGSSFGGLTEREHEVLVFVAQGMTDLEISRRLFISPRTVNAHLRSIYGKLEVTNRTSAVRRAIDHGLV
jgi:ATP/maltotriose-dependent transcriptional regulator MalT